MGSEWVQVSAADLIRAGVLIIQDGYRAKNSELSASGLPFARAGNIRDGFQFDQADRFPEDALHRVGQKVSRPGDVVFTSKGTVGRFAFVREDTPRFVYSPQLCFWRALDPQRLDPQWLFYWMQSDEFRHQYMAVAGQTDMAAYVSLRDQRRMVLTVPPIAVQRAVAHVLGVLDDKIEQLRRMNETLEAIARTIFKSWFVDFDPVIVNALRAGNPIPETFAARAAHYRENPAALGLASDTLRLFPDRFVMSETGQIPEGWRTSRLKEMTTIKGGKQLPAARRRRAGGYPVFGANGIMGYCDRATHHGFVIAFGRVGAYCGSLNWTYEGAWINNNASSVVPLSHDEFVLQSMLATDFASMRQGSAQPFIPNSALAETRIVVPDSRVREAFCDVVRPMRWKQYDGAREVRVLAALRDALLPRLISGELRIPDAERILEESA